MKLDSVDRLSLCSPSLGGLSSASSPMEELQYMDSAAGSTDTNILGRTIVPSYFHATGLHSSGPSHRDPQQRPGSFSTSQQDRPPQDAAAFDRFYSLVEVCAAAGSPFSPLNSSSSYHERPPATIPHPISPPLPSMVRAPPSDTEDEPTLVPPQSNDSTSRNRRRHACKMCDKAFDRPSTLKTHLLVHTGITPFACPLCGRRFGVQSNCNRHIRRCTLRSELFQARRREFESSQSGHSRPSTTRHLHEPQRSSESRSPSPPAPPKPKRARRKRSPAATWIPQSLASFKLPSMHAAAPVPLPPVRPRTSQEERDSYTDCHDQPYTEQGWSGRLPGPAPVHDPITQTLNSTRRRSVPMR